MRFTVTQKIITSLAIILVIGAVSMIIVYDGLHTVQMAMIELAEAREPLVTAANEMEINMNGIAMLVLRYLNTANPNYRRRVERDERDFKQFHDQFFQLAGNRTLKELGDQYYQFAGNRTLKELGETVGVLYKDFQILGRELMDKKDKQEMIFATIAQQFERIDNILDTKLQHFIDLESPDESRKVIKSLDVEADTAEIGMWLANYQRFRDDKYRRLLFENEAEFREGLEQFKGFSLTEEERHWADIIEETFNQTMTLIREVVGLEDYLEAVGNLFSALRSEIDDILDHEIGPLVRHDLYTPRRGADQATAYVISTFRFLIPLFLLSAIATAFLLIRVITNPVKRLMQGTDAISHGDLNYRLVPTGRDEFADLAHHFNEMVAQLQATTVSKGLLEASEAKLQETVVDLRREIAERRLAQEEQARLQASLRRSETMAAMGSLVAGVAHEVRNPLFGISSILDAFEARFGSREEYQRYLRALRGELNRLSELMQELLEYGRPLSSELTPQSVEDVIAESVEACAALAKRANVEIASEIRVALPLVNMDRRRLLQVFHNLLENAVQHSPPGGTVMVEAETRRDDGQDWVDCVITDSGPGFQTEELPRIFEPFFTRRSGGTGLGLSIVQRIIEELHGTIAASNRPGGGAVMTVRLPSAES
jgi:signal transduction histidine kinase/CHASE3 domain sensor protein